MLAKVWRHAKGPLAALYLVALFGGSLWIDIVAGADAAVAWLIVWTVGMFLLTELVPQGARGARTLWASFNRPGLAIVAPGIQAPMLVSDPAPPRACAGTPTPPRARASERVVQRVRPKGTPTDARRAPPLPLCVACRGPVVGLGVPVDGGGVEHESCWERRARAHVEEAKARSSRVSAALHGSPAGASPRAWGDRRALAALLVGVLVSALFGAALRPSSAVSVSATSGAIQWAAAESVTLRGTAHVTSHVRPGSFSINLGQRPRSPLTSSPWTCTRCGRPIGDVLSGENGPLEITTRARGSEPWGRLSFRGCFECLRDFFDAADVAGVSTSTTVRRR